MSEPVSEDPEQFAEEAGVDPTPQEVDHYLELAEEVPPWSDPEPDAEPDSAPEPAAEAIPEADASPEVESGSEPS
ncbi:hypothetical protein AB0A74_17065 [Saccharothrix sp. NPDC042600]|uniref:hypothetical protein n=1 Tax=Saccharothrix TaxID=2071 RepID=UPI0033C94E80|nr:hypothetical protein GCM10017745_73500 [Saccharothrix mutabilis subsp. capreolus]